MKREKTEPFSFATAFLAALTAASDAPCQEPRETAARTAIIEEIIVTAQRREERAQDVPIAMSVFSREFIRQNISDLYEVANLVPNYQIDNSEGLTRSNVAIRGLGSTDWTDPIAATGILTYYDGIAAGTPFISAIPFWDLDRIEILRGPQGTLFGRNAVAGAVQYLSAAPTDEFEGYGEFTAGEFDLRRFEGAVSGPVTNRLKARLSAVSYSRSGDITNTFLNTRWGEREWWGVRGIIDWQISKNLDMRIKAQYFDGDQDEIFFNAAPGALMPPDFQAWFDAVGHDPDLSRESNYSRLQSVLQDPIGTVETRMVELVLNHDFGPVRLTAIGGYLDSENPTTDEPLTMPAQVATQRLTADLTQWSGEVRLTSQTDHPLQWIAGAYYQHTEDSRFGAIDLSAGFRDLDGDGRTRHNPDSPEDLLDGLLANPAFAGATNLFFEGGADQELETYAFFLHTTYDWSDRLSTTQGVRYTNEKKSIDFRFSSLFEFPVSIGVIPGTPAQHNDFVRFSRLTPVQQRQQAVSILFDPNTLDAEGNVVPFPLSETWQEVTWRFAADYHLTEDAMIYTSVNRGFRGGIFPTIIDPTAAVSAEPETSIVYEVGTKTRWFDNRLQVNASLFYNDHSNFQALLFALRPDGTFAHLLSNVPEAELYGGEIEIQAVPFDNLYVAASLGILETKVTKVTPGNEAILGNKLSLAEDVNFGGLLHYDVATALGTFSPQLGWRYRGKYWSTKDNDDLTGKLGGFWTADLRIGYESPNRKLYGLLYWKNIFDEVQPIFTNQPLAAVGTTASYINERRNWGVSIGYRF